MSGRCSPPPSGGHPAFTDRPTVPELKELLSELVDWRRFGAHLPGITSRMIDILGKYGDQSISSRKEALFTKWLRAYEKASWMDVITTLFISGEFKLLSSVADDIKRRYTSSKHGQTTSESSQATNGKEQTTSIADDDAPPNDAELKRNAKRAITRNIDKLANVISSSVSSFKDTVLGCEAKELITTSFKNRLLDTLTGLDMQSRVTELLSFIQNFVSLNSSYLDVFLTVLIANYGKTGKEIAGNIAKEYGHKLPLYDERVAAKVIGAVGGAVSSNDTTEVTLISENQVKEDIKTLYQSFGSVIKTIRHSLKYHVSGSNVYDIATYIEAIIGPLGLTQVTTIDELFDKIQPHYSFLDCELLEAIVNEFLSAENELQIELTQYIEKVNKFTESSRLLHIKTAIEKSLISITDTTCRIVIKLSKKWGRITLKHFYDVLEYLFSTRKNILAHIHIEEGSIIISFIAPLSQSQYFIDNVLSKKNFLQRIGIIEVSINDQSILPARVDDINLNESLLEASEEGDQLGVTILLQLEASVNYYNSEGKTSLMLACSGGHEHVVQTLLSANADVNILDWRRYTPLMRAVESHSIRIVSSLLEHNADTNKVASDNKTALILACTSFQADAVDLLLSYNADVSILGYKALKVSIKTDNNFHILPKLIPHVPRPIVPAMLILAVEYGQHLMIAALLKRVDPHITAEQLLLSISCCNGDYRSVMKLIHHPKVNLKYPLSPIAIASSCGHLPIVELLLKQKISVDIKSIGDYTSLMFASANGHLHVVKLLLKRHADVNIKSYDSYTALMLASEKGYHQIVELLIKENAGVNCCDVDGCSALILASQNGHYQVVELLLKQHADVNICNNLGTTALLMACQNNHYQVVELLLKAHADVNIRTYIDLTALIFASELGHHQVVQLLLNNHADVNICDINGFTALILASQNGHHQVVELLLSKDADCNICSNNGATALIAASQYGHHQVVELLLNAHADVNTRDNNYGCTALILASKNGHHQVVELLLNKHADVNICDNNGYTALMFASLIGYHQIVELLLKKPNIHINTALLLGSQFGRHQVVELLLKEHADVNIRDNNGCTALILASQFGHHHIVELLLNQHADANIYNNNGFTALTLASYNGHQQVMKLLLMGHVDVNICAKHNNTALILASQNGHYRVVELLLNQDDADVNIRNNEGSTALIAACVHNHQDVVKLLLTKDINDNDKWLSLMIASNSDHNEIVEILLNELDTSQTDSSNSTGFKPVHDELIIESEGQDDYTIQPATQSSVDPFMLNQKEKKMLLKNLTRKTKLTSSSALTPPIDVEFLMQCQPKGKPSPLFPLPLTTLPLEHSRVI